MYLESGVLPADEILAKHLVLERSYFTVQDGVLHVDAARENSLQIQHVAVHVNSQKKLLEEIHGGSLTGHFAPKSTVHACSTSWLGSIGGKGCMVTYTITAMLASVVLLTTVLAINTELPYSPFQFLGHLKG